MKNRREFLKIMATGSAATIASPLYARNDDWVKLTILHTNDMHSRIDPFPENNPKYAGLGGFARLSGKINSIREEEENTLLLDAGDIFQGTPYFNLFGGELEFKLMSKMGYFASTIGNHDLDNGIDGLVDKLEFAKFQFINCNYDLSQTRLKEHVVPYKIKDIKGIRIGILGVGIELEGLVDKKNYGDIIYNDPITNSQKIAAYLKEEKKCDLVICLSHLGYSYEDERISDLDLARENKHIDLIIGGHTHTFFKEPLWIKSKFKKSTLINQVGWAGIELGKIDFHIHKLSGESELYGRNLIVNSLV